jgi:CAAX protease family protein
VRTTRTLADQGELQMDVSIPLTEAGPPSRADVAVSTVEIPQYRKRGIFAVWAAAALPMAALAWLVAPALADRLSGEGNVPLAKALIVLLTIGLVWQFVFVAILVCREQHSLRWSTLREALWLRSPRSPRSGRVGGRV